MPKGAQVSKEEVPDRTSKAEERTKLLVDQARNGKKPTAEELLAKCEKEGKKVFKEKSKPKKKENLPRNDTKDLEAFVEHCVKSLDTQLVMVPVSNKQIPQEWVLEHKGKRVAWICPRASMRFGVYLFLKGQRDIIKVYTKDDMDNVFSKIKSRCEELDQEPEPKPKISKNGKGRQNSVIAKLEEAEARAKSNKMSNGFSLGNIKVTQDVVDWVESKGYTLQSRSIKW